MEARDYIVEDIRGDYAFLRELTSSEVMPVALALLPLEISIGTRLHWEMLEYTISE